MILHASKTLSAILGAGFVPKQFTAVGPYDEGPVPAATGPMINRTSRPGANRVLACEFDPLGGQDEKQAALASINAVVGQLQARILESDEQQIGRARTFLAELRYTNPGGTTLSIRVAAFALDGILYRFTLSALDQVAGETRAALVEVVRGVAG